MEMGNARSKKEEKNIKIVKNYIRKEQKVQVNKNFRVGSEFVVSLVVRANFFFGGGGRRGTRVPSMHVQNVGLCATTSV